MEEQNMTGAQTPTGTPGPNNRGTQPPIRTKRNPWIYVIIALCILIPALVAGGFYFYVNKQETEEQAYALLNNNENVEDYENYLTQFPNSAHADEVRDRLKQLRTMYADWQRIANSGYASDFERFSQNYPQSQLVKQCELKIDSLDWETAKKINTPDAISDYLEKHPDGRYAQDASQLQNTLVKSIVSPDERSTISSTLHGFFEAFGNNDETSLFTYITPTMTQFLNKQNATKADVGNLLKKTYSGDIESCSFVVNDDYQIKKTVDDQGNASYTVACSVDQHIIRSGEGKTFGSYTISAKLNSEMKISSLTMKEISRADN
jgi:gas vesicle protein gvpC repeat-containing domain protein